MRTVLSVPQKQCAAHQTQVPHQRNGVYQQPYIPSSAEESCNYDSSFNQPPGGLSFPGGDYDWADLTKYLDELTLTTDCFGGDDKSLTTSNDDVDEVRKIHYN
jgi:hypothetical protein